MNNEKLKIVHSLYFPVTFLSLIWITWISFAILDIDMAKIGIYPLKPQGLIGVVLSPFAHGNLSHLLANSTSFLILSVGLFYFYRLIAYRVFFINWFLSGALLWLGGRESVHIGASGLVYGLAFFLFFSGIFRKDRKLAAISLIVVFFYGSMLWGMLPQGNNISWEGHLFGAITGLSLAWYYRLKPIDFLPVADGSSVSVTWGRYDQYEYNYIFENEDDETK